MMRHSGLRYVLVSGLCAAVHNLIMVGGAAAGLHYAAATAASFIILIALGFVLHSRFTYAMPATRSAFWRYAGAMAMNLPLWLALMFALGDLAGLPIAIASPAGTILLALWNYAAVRWAILRRREAER